MVQLISEKMKGAFRYSNMSPTNHQVDIKSISLIHHAVNRHFIHQPPSPMMKINESAITQMLVKIFYKIKIEQFRKLYFFNFVPFYTWKF